MLLLYIIVRISTGIRGFGRRSSHICLSIHEIGTSPSSVIAVTLMVATTANERARGLQKYSLQKVAFDFVKFTRIIVYQLYSIRSPHPFEPIILYVYCIFIYMYV